MVVSPVESALSDEQLAETVARRDRSTATWQEARQACDQLYLRHSRKLVAFLAARVRRSELEDVHQAVWQRVWQYLPEGFRGGNFRAWLYQIARNHVIDQGRKKRPEPLRDDLPLPDPRTPGPVDMLLDRERMAILGRCLEHLDEDASAVVQARLAGESYLDICQRLGWKPERAHKLFHQAKDQLRRCVERASP
jgi:RNA polymerase sigma-70 factor (ECF subfamily)